MSAPLCQKCKRVIGEGELAWASDWRVLNDPEEMRTETRYTCDDCEASA